MERLLVKKCSVTLTLDLFRVNVVPANCHCMEGQGNNNAEAGLGLDFYINMWYT